MAAFSEQQRQRFEDEMVVHLTRAYPDQVRPKGEKWLRELIRLGIQTSPCYNIVLEADVARYLEFMLVLAPDFDTSSKTPWAKEILTQRRLTTQQKLERLDEKSLAEHEEGAAGGAGGH